jgi:hypothetical protein
MRNWEKMEDDEMWAIWSQFLRSEFNYDPLRLDYVENATHQQPVRLTPMEIIKLTECLFKKLDEKYHKKKGC